jgi:hypothetical protein
VKKPDPESTSIITHDFDDLTGSLVPPDQLERLKYVGEPLFTEKEMNASCDLLVHTFRQLCVVEHISQKYFDEKYKIYAITVLGKTPQAAMNNKSNIVKMLKRGDKLSWKKFIELTHLVLGLKPEIVNIIFSRTKNKEEIEISTKAAEMQ